MASVTAAKLANFLSFLEILALVIGGSLICFYVLNTSLLLLIALTLCWTTIIFLENLALSGESYGFLIFVATIRILVLTSLCIVPIVLASYYSKSFGT